MPLIKEESFLRSLPSPIWSNRISCVGMESLRIRSMSIYNGVDIRAIPSRNRQYREEIRKAIRHRRMSLLYFLSPITLGMKGLGYLIRALARLKKEDHPPFKLLILGRDRKNPYLRLAKKIGISEESHFCRFDGRTREILWCRRSSCPPYLL